MVLSPSLPIRVRTRVHGASFMDATWGFGCVKTSPGISQNIFSSRWIALEVRSLRYPWHNKCCTLVFVPLDFWNKIQMAKSTTYKVVNEISAAAQNHKLNYLWLWKYPCPCDICKCRVWSIETLRERCPLLDSFLWWNLSGIPYTNDCLI